MKRFSGLDEFAAAEGTQLGPTEWLEVTQDRVNLFADATDDHQWIHVDPERAAEGPFGGTIAHGLLTLSLLPHFTHQLYTVDNIAMAINYGYNKVRFITPVPVGAKIRARAEIAKVDQLDGAVQATVATRSKSRVRRSRPPWPSRSSDSSAETSPASRRRSPQNLGVSGRFASARQNFVMPWSIEIAAAVTFFDSLLASQQTASAMSSGSAAQAVRTFIAPP